MMDLTSRAAELFLAQPPQEQQAFLRVVLKSASWQHETSVQPRDQLQQLTCTVIRVHERPSTADVIHLKIKTPLRHDALVDGNEF